VALNPNDFLLGLYAQNPAALWNALELAAEQKGMDVDDFVRGYGTQLGRFKDVLLADLP